MIFYSHLFLSFFFAGNRSRHADEACSNHFFSRETQPLKYMLADGKSEDCPFNGRFEDVKAQQQQQQPAVMDQVGNSGLSGQVMMNNNNNYGWEKCVNWIQAGCPLSNNMLINFCSTTRRRESKSSSTGSSNNKMVRSNTSSLRRKASRKRGRPILKGELIGLCSHLHFHEVG